MVECQGIGPDGERGHRLGIGDGERLLVMVAGLTRSTPMGSADIYIYIYIYIWVPIKPNWG